jgi:hypothetical protein
MNKNFLLMLLLSSSISSFGQARDNDDVVVDSISNTNIEKLLRQTNITRKVEFIQIDKAKVLQCQLIIITNLATGIKVKGLYLSNQGGTNIWAGVTKSERHAFLDENEIDDLISFLENCDSKWRKEKPKAKTSYEFETLDNFKINFWTKKNSNSWDYGIKFSNYIFDNIQELSKSQPDDLLNTLKQARIELQEY